MCVYIERRKKMLRADMKQSLELQISQNGDRRLLFNRTVTLRVNWLSEEDAIGPYPHRAYHSEVSLACLRELRSSTENASARHLRNN